MELFGSKTSPSQSGQRCVLGCINGDMGHCIEFGVV